MKIKLKCSCGAEGDFDDTVVISLSGHVEIHDMVNKWLEYHKKCIAKLFKTDEKGKIKEV